jgi:acylphosphatase
LRNRRTGTVEAVFAGETATLDKVIEICRKGPPQGRVDSIDQREATPDELGMRGGQSFVVLPTV